MKKIYIAAGGTGGHINGALSLKETFSQDFDVCFISGQRYLDYQLFKNENVKHFAGKALRSKNLFIILKNFLINLFVAFKIFFLFIKDRPSFVIGTGGYICGPTLLIAKILFIPIFILEQNAVAGLTNKILAKISDISFLSFSKTKGIPLSKKVIVSGNPIRSEIKYVENIVKDKINILIFGGSLGASQLSPIAKELSKNSNYNILHQVGTNNSFDFNASNYKQVEYIDNMQEAYNWSNIILSRSGASSVFELDIIKRPTLFIPYKYATDNHQYLNAKELLDKKAFPVFILDPLLSENDLCEKAIEHVKKIVETKNYYPFKETITEKASLKIKAKIYEYLKI